MLAGLRCNSDVQLPYRLPIIESTHCCNDPKCLDFKEKDLIEATQIAQDAQAGYACDYCSKRQPLAFNECKECVKGLQRLSERYRDDPLNKLGKRYAMRIMSDAYGKCCVRAAVENTNLLAYAREDDITRTGDAEDAVSSTLKESCNEPRQPQRTPICHLILVLPCSEKPASVSKTEFAPTRHHGGGLV